MGHVLNTCPQLVVLFQLKQTFRSGAWPVELSHYRQAFEGSLQPTLSLLPALSLHEQLLAATPTTGTESLHYDFPARLAENLQEP